MAAPFNGLQLKVERLRAENQALLAKLDQAQGQLQSMASVAIRPLEEFGRVGGVEN
ncbi:hypothetical protein JOY44_30995 (plasmid) [Phormidium sp. CLA17]|uniref:hypothetical protein n=1 Tax=Leptolyngbya sp. Cla-17 TaxID=2803751 RepID=UPI001492E92A|nr:hypothetical protein [Leptolyngbya sp. Cla-17]MBM0745796.1 hypothetical protein [Leptolyngbya sp. Cla-17]